MCACADTGSVPGSVSGVSGIDQCMNSGATAAYTSTVLWAWVCTGSAYTQKRSHESVEDSSRHHPITSRPTQRTTSAIADRHTPWTVATNSTSLYQLGGAGAHAGEDRQRIRSVARRVLLLYNRRLALLHTALGDSLCCACPADAV